MPTFVDVKRWILEAAREMGANISTRRAKSLAGDYLTIWDGDPGLRHSVLTYNDPTGEKACKAWFKAVAA